MIDGGGFKDIAKHNADAVRGLQPEINIWTGAPGTRVGEVGSSGCGSGGAMKEIAGLDIAQDLKSLYGSKTGLSETSTSICEITLYGLKF
ncbi:hypothetical protein ACET3Z_004037 [Daucus carota]